eukprot:CAMPEP_0197676208 /NCGR_PEP_ID=MMETSP1338-20131121/86384_1 /TAXON_ID=43686 ORGANISM="Pelagodinium beii, Strain RCC1491" /NCGR_SAMPLE_ID=MMETSP1338 /ASSEMBLY_ACC=CAM_ASM_000754 /LENGTH=36 /DNA_ID= /DNA_START= /DNA_END= /DNA_ORIENTATION=
MAEMKLRSSGVQVLQRPTSPRSEKEQSNQTFQVEVP